jgi:hypothetical protein
MISTRCANRWWQLTTLLGFVLIVVGDSAFYIDVAARFRFDFIEQNYETFGLSILSGVVLAFIGCIGWAKSGGKKARALMAGSVFITPWMLLLGGSPIDGFNVHGPSMISAMLVLPATVLAATLLVMAAVTQK